MNIDAKDLLTVTFTLFAIVDIVGSVPILISIKEKVGGIYGSTSLSYMLY